MDYKSELMVKICKLYYEEGYNFNEISEKLKLSRYKIYRMIQKAKDEGIVKITISKPTKSLVDIENKIEKQFKLKRVYIIENQGLSEEELRDKLGQSGAEFLQEIMIDNDIIGISWGLTVKKILDYLPIKINKKIKVVQLSSGSNLVEMDMICHDLTKQLAQRFNTYPFLLFAPQIVGNKELKDLLLKDDTIKRTFNLFDKINIAIFGIGALTENFKKMLLDSKQLNKEELKILANNNAVGDIFSNYIDFNGNLCDKKLSSRLITMPLDKLKSIPYSIAIAGGIEKAKAILSAIRGGLLNVLITDSLTINEISKLNNNGFE